MQEGSDKSKAKQKGACEGKEREGKRHNISQ